MNNTTINGIIILLGAPNDEHGNLSSIAMERCGQAILEYKRNPGFTILPTGGFGEHFNRTDKSHAHYTSRYLISHGIPEYDILEHAESSNTVEDARLSKPIVMKYKPRRLIIITSDFHRDRAGFLFRKEFPGMDITLSCSSTILPENELKRLREHEAKALDRLRITNS